jgi:hypothetical protein
VVAGDPAFAAAHAQQMEDIQRLAAPFGAVVLLADAAPIDEGAFSGSDMAEPERVGAWNDVLRDLDARWANVGVVPWSGMLEDIEAAEGSVRADGVHIDLAELTRLVPDHIEPLITEGVAAVRAEAEAVGCRVRDRDAGGWRLDLARCRTG